MVSKYMDSLLAKLGRLLSLGTLIACGSSSMDTERTIGRAPQPQVSRSDEREPSRCKVDRCSGTNLLFTVSDEPHSSGKQEERGLSITYRRRAIHWMQSGALRPRLAAASTCFHWISADSRAAQSASKPVMHASKAARRWLVQETAKCLGSARPRLRWGPSDCSTAMCCSRPRPAHPLGPRRRLRLQRPATSSNAVSLSQPHTHRRSLQPTFICSPSTR